MNFTPEQLYAVVAVIAFALSAVLLFKKAFDFVRPEELKAVASDMKALEVELKTHIENQTTSRHEIRRELAAVQGALIRVETLMEGIQSKLDKL